MKRSRMARAWVLPACVVALAAVPVVGLRAQGQPQQSQSQYQGLGDSPETPSTLDKDYGMSFLGAPGSDQQKTQAPVKDPPPTADFLQPSTDPRLPKPPTVGRSETETPLYTTTEGSETGDTRSATGETPLYTTTDGSETGGARSAPGAAALSDDGSDTTDGGIDPAAAGTPR